MKSERSVEDWKREEWKIAQNVARVYIWQYGHFLVSRVATLERITLPQAEEKLTDWSFNDPLRITEIIYGISLEKLRAEMGPCPEGAA